MKEIHITRPTRTLEDMIKVSCPDGRWFVATRAEIIGSASEMLFKSELNKDIVFLAGTVVSYALSGSEIGYAEWQFDTVMEFIEVYRETVKQHDDFLRMYFEMRREQYETNLRNSKGN